MSADTGRPVTWLAEQELAGEELAGRLRLATGRLTRLLGRQTAAGLTLSQWSALATIARYGPLRMGELAARERVSGPTLSRLVAGLEAEGLAERRADPADARAHQLTATLAGRQRLAGQQAASTALLAGLLAGLVPAQRGILAVAVPVLEELVDQLSGRAGAPGNELA